MTRHISEILPEVLNNIKIINMSDNWIRIDSILPKPKSYVLVYATGGRMLTAYFKENSFYCYDVRTEELEEIEEPTHWQPLPPPPKRAA